MRQECLLLAVGRLHATPRTGGAGGGDSRRIQNTQQQGHQKRSSTATAVELEMACDEEKSHELA